MGLNFKEKKLNEALESFVSKTKAILGDKVEMICLFGSVTYDDLAPHYGDLDFNCLLNDELTKEEIEELFAYRDELKRSANIYSQMLEGEFAPLKLINKEEKADVAYWGTSRVKVFDKINVRTFSLIGLISKGIVIYGNDLRDTYQFPTDEEMIADVYNMIETVRKHAEITDENIHSVDWLFLISQSMYWLKNNDVTSKTNAARWVLENKQSSWVQSLNKAIELRQTPQLAQLEENKSWLSDLGPIIQEACDDLELLVNRRKKC